MVSRSARRLSGLLAVSAYLLAVTGAAHGATRYVSPGQSIADAVAASAAGDTVIVRGGTYPRQFITDRAFTAPVSVRGAAGESVTVGGFDVSASSNITISDLHLNAQSKARNNAHHIVFTRLTCSVVPTDTGESCFRFENLAHDIELSDSVLKGGQFAVKFGCWGTAWTSDIRLVRNEMTGAYKDLIQVDCGRNTTIEDNFLHDPLVNENHNDAVQSIASDGLRVLRNRITFVNFNGTGSPGQGVMLGHADPADPARKVQNTLVANNLIHHWVGTPINIAGTINTKIVNNTAYDSGSNGGGYAIWITAKGLKSDGYFQNTGLEIWNNIFNYMAVGEGSNQPSYCDYNIMGAGSTCGAHGIVGDPQFVDRTSYRLRSTSPAIDSGVVRTGTPGVDLFNLARTLPDRGAIEAGATSTPPATTTPTTPADTVAPVVAWKAPVAGALVSGSLTGSACEATATDAVGVSQVEFFLDGTLLNKELTAPYNCVFDSTRVADGTHVLRARAQDAAGNASVSEITVTVANAVPTVDATAPSVPVNLTATPASSSVSLSWGASSDNVGVAGYRVYRSGVLAATATGTTATVSGLSPATSYSFTVAAFDAAGNASAHTAPVSATTLAPADTVAPTVAWKAPVHAATVAGLLANAACEATATDDVGIASVEFLVDGVAANRELFAPYNCSIDTRTLADGPHVLRAIARDAAGNTSSAAITVTVLNTVAVADTVAPSVPTGLAATATASSVTLTWAASSDNVSVAGYRVYRSGTLVATVSGTSATIGGLAPSTTYSFTVAAFDPSGNQSAHSGPVSIKTRRKGASTLRLLSATRTSVSLQASAAVAARRAHVVQGGRRARVGRDGRVTLRGLRPGTRHVFLLRVLKGGRWTPAGRIAAATRR